MELQFCKLLPSEADFNFWLKNKYNVLMSGGPGVGKTTMIVNAFERSGLKFRYFSAPTMDPWVDFVGIPQECTDEKGKYLDLVRLKEFRDDEIQAIFFDEFNRAPKKVRNAVMELMQYKSINGRKFHNLQVIWAAVNPFDEAATFDVEKLDPAQMDRFQIQIELPHVPNAKFFTEKYGVTQSKVAIDWWNKLPKNVQVNVTPRRLDVALECARLGGDIQHVLPSNSTWAVLKTHLESGSPKEKLFECISKKDKIAARKLLSSAKNFDYLLSEVKKNLTFLFDCISQERQSSFLAENDNGAWAVVDSNPKPYKDLLENMSKSSNQIVANKSIGIMRKLRIQEEAELKKLETMEESTNKYKPEYGKYNQECGCEEDSGLNYDTIVAGTLQKPKNKQKAYRYFKDFKAGWEKESVSMRLTTAVEKEVFSKLETQMVRLLSEQYNTNEWIELVKKLMDYIDTHGVTVENVKNVLNVLNCLFGRLQPITVERFSTPAFRTRLVKLILTYNASQKVSWDGRLFLNNFPNLAKYDWAKYKLLIRTTGY